MNKLLKVLSIIFFLGMFFLTIFSKNVFAEQIYLNRNLKLGDYGEDVKLLQQFLNSNTTTKIAEIGPGSPKNETEYFGLLTKQAVIRFQEKYRSEILVPIGLQFGTGIVGEMTRKKINSLMSSENIKSTGETFYNYNGAYTPWFDNDEGGPNDISQNSDDQNENQNSDTENSQTTEISSRPRISLVSPGIVENSPEHLTINGANFTENSRAIFPSEDQGAIYGSVNGDGTVFEIDYKSEIVTKLQNALKKLLKKTSLSKSSAKSKIISSVQNGGEPSAIFYVENEFGKSDPYTILIDLKKALFVNSKNNKNSNTGGISGDGNSDGEDSSGDSGGDGYSSGSNGGSSSDSSLLGGLGGAVGGAGGGSFISGSGGGGIGGTLAGPQNETPFGGMHLLSIECTCGAGEKLNYINDYASKKVLGLLYVPGQSRLYQMYNLYGLYYLGTYRRGSQTCRVYAGESCVDITADGVLGNNPGTGTSN